MNPVINTGSSLVPDPIGPKVSPWREFRVFGTEVTAMACIMILAIKGAIDGHFALLGIMGVLMRSLTPFLGERR
jgi:hypothetical protein